MVFKSREVRKEYRGRYRGGIEEKNVGWVVVMVLLINKEMKEGTGN